MIQLDVSGKDCPIPVLSLQSTLERCVPGDIIEIKFTCPEAIETIPFYCNKQHHKVLEIQQLNNDGWIIKIRK